MKYRIALLIAATAAPAVAQPEAVPQNSFLQAVADPSRPAIDKGRDPERKPAQMLEFAGIRPGMTVVDLLAGGGYFTRLFSTAVGPKGHVFAFVADDWTNRNYSDSLAALTKLASEPGRENVRAVHHPLTSGGPSNVVDVEWLAQNYHDLHNIPGLDVAAFNRMIFNELKPGGVFIVVDHSATSGSGTSRTNDLHRIEGELVKREITRAGFIFDGESKVLSNPDDKRDLMVFDPSLRGHTDQFVYRFRKPRT